MDKAQVKRELLDGAKAAVNPAAGDKQYVHVPLDAAHAAVGENHPVLKDCRCSNHKDIRNGPREFVEVPLAEWIDALEGQESRVQSPGPRDKTAPPKAA